MRAPFSTRSTHGDAEGGGAAAAPGKRTLTQAVPAAPARRPDRAALAAPAAAAVQARPADPFDFTFGAAARSDAVHAAAQAGVAGAGGGLPHAGAIAASFGPDHALAGVTAHVGGAAAAACDRIGASAYATGADVAFRAAPDLHTAAHEAAHVIQQRAGVQLDGGVGAAGDPYEQHADAVADRVVAGQSARALLPATGGGAPTAAVQRYQEPTYGEPPHDRSPYDAPPFTAPPFAGSRWRISNAGDVMVRQDDPTHLLLATREQADHSNQALAAQGSFLRLDVTGDSHVVDGRTLHVLRPRLVLPEDGDPDNKLLDKANRKDDPELSMWADCGRTGRAVMGVDDQDIEGDGERLKAEYWTHGEPTYRSVTYSPRNASSSMWPAVMHDYLAAQPAGWFEQHAAWFDRHGIDPHGALAEEAARKIYAELLMDAERLAFDQLGHVNTAADPGIGDAYAITPEKKGESPWSRHWGGVVMESGTDNITLESYAPGGAATGDDQAHARAYDLINTAWDFQMYGTEAARPEQSFQRQHAATFDGMATTYTMHAKADGE